MSSSIFLKLVDFCLYRNVENESRKLPDEQAKTIIFYDHTCPLCRFEMARLREMDRHEKLAQIDISAANFIPDEWSLNLKDLNAALHVLTSEGEWLVGMSAVRHVYRQINMGWLVKVTEFPLISSLLDAGYLRFARNRMAISRMLGASLHHPGCADGVCELRPNIERKQV